MRQICISEIVCEFHKINQDVLGHARGGMADKLVDYLTYRQTNYSLIIYNYLSCVDLAQDEIQ